MKVASRYLLPLEIVMAAQALAWAVSGGIGKGQLWYILLLKHENLVWVSVMGLVGLAMLALATVEWRCGRTWPVSRIHLWVTLRAVVNFLAVAMWLYALYMIITYDLERQVVVLYMTAPIYAFASGWCFWENEKVRHALDDRYATSTLTFHR